jgi:hypothetical protein
MKDENKSSAEAEQEGEVVMGAGVLYFKTYSDLIEQVTSNWAMLAMTMDAALVIKSRIESRADEADMIMAGAASSFFKDMDTLKAVFGSLVDTEEYELGASD